MRSHSRPQHARRVRAYECAPTGSGCRPQPWGLKTRAIDGGFFSSFETGRIGRGVRLPPQFGQRPRRLFSTQSRQKVHS